MPVPFGPLHAPAASANCPGYAFAGACGTVNDTEHVAPALVVGHVETLTTPLANSCAGPLTLPMSQPACHVSDCVFAEMYCALRLLLAAVADELAFGTRNWNVSLRVDDALDAVGRTLLALLPPPLHPAKKMAAITAASIVR